MVYRKTDKTEEQKDEKRILIFETSAKIFAEKGYHQTSVKDITKAANISVGTFYLYFKNKEDVFEKLYDKMYEIISNVNNYAIYSKDMSIVEQFCRAISSSIWTYMRFKELAKILIIEAINLNTKFKEKYSNLLLESCSNMENILSNLKEKNLIDIPDAKIAAISYESSFNGLISYWLRANDNSNLIDYIYPFSIYTLQALKIKFNDNEVKMHIEIFITELNNESDKFIRFN